MKSNRTDEGSGGGVPAVELNQTWDVGRLVDLTCDYFDGMPVDMTGTLPSFRMRELDEEMEALCRGREYRSYTQEVRRTGDRIPDERVGDNRSPHPVDRPSDENSRRMRGALPADRRSPFVRRTGRVDTRMPVAATKPTDQRRSR